MASANRARQAFGAKPHDDTPPSAQATTPWLQTGDLLRVLVVSEIRLFQDAFAALLGRQAGVCVIGTTNPLQAAAQTAELTRDVEGRHTTTTARWYQLAATSAIIDAPGVRDFAPPASLVRAAERGFVEIHQLSVNCRFKDCRHMEEPGCAVRIAVVARQIASRRYESYRRLFRLYEKLAP